MTSYLGCIDNKREIESKCLHLFCSAVLTYAESSSGEFHCLQGRS